MNYFGYDPSRFVNDYREVGQVGQYLSRLPGQISDLKTAAQTRDIREQQAATAEREASQRIDIRDIAKQNADLELKKKQSAYELGERQPEILGAILEGVEEEYQKNLESGDEIKRNRAKFGLKELGNIKLQVKNRIKGGYADQKFVKQVMDYAQGAIQDEAMNVDRAAKNTLLSQKPPGVPWGEFTAKTPGLKPVSTKELGSYPITQVGSDSEKINELKRRLFMQRIKAERQKDKQGLDYLNTAIKGLTATGKAIEQKEKSVKDFNNRYKKELNAVNDLRSNLDNLNNKAEWIIGKVKETGEFPNKPTKGIAPPQPYTQSDLDSIISEVDNTQKKMNNQISVLENVGKEKELVYDENTGIFKSIPEYQETQDILTKVLREGFEPEESKTQNKIVKQLEEGVTQGGIGLRGPARIREVETKEPVVEESPAEEVTPADTTGEVIETEETPFETTREQVGPVTGETPRTKLEKRFQTFAEEETKKSEKSKIRDSLHKGIEKIVGEIGKAKYKAATDQQLDKMINTYKQKLKDNARDTTSEGFGKRQNKINGILSALQKLKAGGSDGEKVKFINNLRNQGKITAKDANLLTGLIPGKQKGKEITEKHLKFKSLVDRLKKEAPKNKKLSDALDYLKPHLLIIENFIKKQGRQNFRSKESFKKYRIGLDNALSQVRRRNKALANKIEELIDLEKLTYKK